MKIYGIGTWGHIMCVRLKWLFTITLWVSSLSAQTPGTGAITGRVTDSSGAIVPEAAVQVIDTQTGSSRKVATSADGTYRAPLLPPGLYSIEVQKTGFQSAVVSNVRVVVTETTVVDLALKIGAVETRVEVSASSEIVQTANVALGRSVTEEVITAIPLANRNFTQILGLSPGVAGAVPDASAIGRNSQNVSANGARPHYNTFQFNGVDATNIAENTASGFGPENGIAVPAPDAIAEFKVQTAMFDASHGRSIGASVDLVSKSGTNEFHGSVWEFFRNDALNANDFFRSRNRQPKPVLKQNQFGFTFGGPIQKNKLFFFGSYQGTRQINGVDPATSSSSAFLPRLTDDRSPAALGALFGGQSGAFGGVAVAPDGSNINPVALALLNTKLPSGEFAIPTPQVILPSGIGQSTFSVPGRFNENQYSVHLDYTLSDKHLVAGRFFSSSSATNTGFLVAGSTVPGWGDNLDNGNKMLTLSDTYQFSPRFVNEARIGYMRFTGLRLADEPITNADIGLTGPTDEPGIPFMTIAGLFNFGPSSTPEFVSTTNMYVAKDTLAYVSGRHSVRAGFEVKRHQVNTAIPFGTRGVLGFLSFPDFLLGMSAAQNGTAVSNISSVLADTGEFDKGFRYLDFSSFIQDDIQLSPRLNVNVGLRWDIFGPPSEVRGRMGNFDLETAVQEPPPTGTFSGIVLPSNFEGTTPEGVVLASDSTLWKRSYKNFGPRLGFAYRLREQGDLVLRGGYGIYFQRVTGQVTLNTVITPPFITEIRSSGAAVAASTLQVPFNPPLPPASSLPMFIPRLPTSAQSLTSYDRDLAAPYTQSYSLNVQYGITRDLMLEVGYAGSRSTHLTHGFLRYNQARIATPENPIHGVTTTTVANVASRVPWLGVSPNSALFLSDGNANYNSLQSSLTKRFSNGLQFLASYTWSKSLDCDSGRDPLNGAELNPVPGDQNNFCLSNYAPSGFDRTNRFVWSFVYQPPSVKSGPAVLRQIASGWELSGVLLLQSGVPFSVLDSRGASIFGVANNSYADCTGADPFKSDSVTERLNAFFDTTAFRPAPPLFNGTGFGNCRRNVLRGPDQRNLDFSVQKAIPIFEDSNLLFRAEFFNLTNTPKFGLPGSNVAAPLTLGVISSTISNPRVIQFALKYNF